MASSHRLSSLLAAKFQGYGILGDRKTVAVVVAVCIERLANAFHECIPVKGCDSAAKGHMRVS